MVLKVISGANKGQIIQLSPQLILGRSKGDVLLQDKSISDPHAEIEGYDNQYFLKDLNSKQGILCNGEKVSHLALKDGLIFRLGSVEFLVQKESDEEKSVSLSKAQVISLNEEGEFLKDELCNIYDEPKEIQFLDKPIKLKFEKGVQKGLMWEIAYLPRKIGSQDADLPLLYPTLQNVSFKLNLENGKIIFSTDNKDMFLVDYKAEDEVELKDQSLIIIGASYIRVSMED